MSRDIESLRLFIKETLGHSKEIGDDQDLLETGVLDSFNIVEIALFIQQTFGVELEGDDVSRNNFKSLNAMNTLINRPRLS